MSRWIAVFALLTIAPSAVAQQTKMANVELVCSANRTSFTPGDGVELAITFQNRGPSDVYVYRTIEWGWTGLRFRLLDSSGHVVALRKPLHVPPPPPPLRDKTQLVELQAGYFYGGHLVFDLALYDLKPGAYFIESSYRSYYKASEGFGLPILTFEDGEFVSNRIEVQIRPN